MPPRKRKAPRRRTPRIVVVRGVRTGGPPRDPATGRWVSVPEDILWDVYTKGAARGRWPALRGLARQVVVPGLGYHLDFGIAGRRLGVEVDGLAFHGGQEAWARDHQRQRRIEAAGWRITRYTAKEASSAPMTVLDELNRLWGR